MKKLTEKQFDEIKKAVSKNYDFVDHEHICIIIEKATRHTNWEPNSFVTHNLENLILRMYLGMIAENFGYFDLGQHGVSEVTNRKTYLWEISKRIKNELLFAKQPKS